MTKFTALIGEYLKVWNETDPAARREAIERVWAASGRYSDPLAVAQGHEEIDRMIAAAQQQFPGLTFELLGDIDALHDQARFRWRLGTIGQEPVAIGFDVLVKDQDDRVELVFGFLDQVPSTPSQDMKTTSSYAVGLLHNVCMGEDIAEYLRRIDDTLVPFSGRFLIHGAPPAQVESRWPGDLIVIEFPGASAAADWYASDAYQAILPLRTDNAEGAVALFTGVEHPHRATDILNSKVTTDSPR